MLSRSRRSVSSPENLCACGVYLCLSRIFRLFPLWKPVLKAERAFCLPVKFGRILGQTQSAGTVKLSILQRSLTPSYYSRKELSGTILKALMPEYIDDTIYKRWLQRIGQAFLLRRGSLGYPMLPSERFRHRR